MTDVVAARTFQAPFVPSSLPAEAARLSDESAARAAGRAFAEAVRPGAAERDQDGVTPVHELELLSRSGLLGAAVPRDYGGAGLSIATLAEVFVVISEADPAVGQIPQNHFAFADRVFDSGNQDQRAFFGREFLRGARLGNALKEKASSRRDAVEMRLTATTSGQYSLSGVKYYCTGALTAQWLPVLALDANGVRSLAYVGRHWPGVTVREDDWFAMGQRGTVSGTAEFDDVVVPSEHVLPMAPHPSSLRRHGAVAQILHAAIDVGIASAVLDDTRAFVLSRSRPAAEAGPIGQASEDPLLLLEFGRLQVRVHAAHALLRRAGELVDAAAWGTASSPSQDAAFVAVLEAKAAAAEIAVDVASALFELAGTSATDTRLGLHRHWRNARTHSLHDPTRWKYHLIADYTLNGRMPAAKESNA